MVTDEHFRFPPREALVDCYWGLLLGQNGHSLVGRLYLPGCSQATGEHGSTRCFLRCCSLSNSVSYAMADSIIHLQTWQQSCYKKYQGLKQAMRLSGHCVQKLVADPRRTLLPGKGRVSMERVCCDSRRSFGLFRSFVFFSPALADLCEI